MKKRIIYFITKSYWGGAAKYVIDLASGLDRNSFEIFIAAGGRGALYEKATELKFDYIEIPHFERRVALLGDILSFFEVLKILRQTKPDTIHVNSSKAGGVCGFAGFVFKLFNSKLLSIFTAHGWAFHEARPKWQLFLIRLLSKITCFFYDRVICITTFDYNSALRYKIAGQKKLVLIHNGLDNLDLKFLKKSEAQQKLFGGEKELVVGTVGEWVRNKGWDILLEAMPPLFEKYPGLILALVAGGEGPEQERIAHERIKIIENLPGAANHLKAFDVFVFPSRKEGLPYALLEASLAGLPIIATAVGGNFDIVENDKTGVLIPPENPEILQKTLDKFLQNLREIKKLGKNARQKVELEFTLEKMRSDTYRLYAA
ncbi:hypothetical protein A2757_00675 [Candidatus Giovannonibacteria bacterium RIFCSPHIGHO2_01_FULL_48_47]|nr:MAG: hypothetical protein A2757_00675 [Candidatus Giovannonibacteria bacterium RIFCSPHIGHO2_01_FULL_48_47]OGF68337.1 MAG: hypothetical protein A3D61_00440 [Candidatus Giovannonibacteria bacterium RIFCSPHIGHO2_02_FULL_48_15]OGF87984.1 MAG: hypothetical protein A3B26_03785 [Candidatus Giovannonibacteria bacterium RIFCSPLOWO2_01_FULL_48_47]OGF95514.1 MAG: hypothetical protein A2433_02160 [Candidatus Giovannonibacteria bacterium RIFOXYC1_FULL_48_8]OGF96209.1 MAG: hypothetical protein A2613_01410